MGTETFPFAITYSNNVFELSQPTNSNYVLTIPLSQAYINTHPTIANFYYFGNVGYAVPLDYTLCTNLTTASRKAQIDAIITLASSGPISGTVAVSNFPATQPVSGTVTALQGTSPWVTSVSNFPATQPVSIAAPVTVNQGTSPWIVTNSVAVPASTDLVGASRTTTGTLVTIPANRVFMGSLSLSASVSLAGNSQPNISAAGTGVAPTGTLHQIIAVGLALTTVATSNTIGNVYIFGGSAGATVTFTQGATGVSTGQIAGRLL